MPRRSLAALLLVAATAVVATAGSSPPEVDAPATGVVARGQTFSPLVGVLSGQQSLKLGRIDPDTLRPIRGRRVGVGSPGCASRSGGEACMSIPPWSFSPGGSLLAVGRNDRHAVRSLRLVDVRRMRVVADVGLAGGPLGLVAWLERRRLLAVQEVCCEERQRLVVVDVARRRMVASRALRGTVLRATRTPRELVLLVAPAKEIGPARLAVVDAAGAVRVLPLERIATGVKLLSPSDHQVEQRLPALAVDAGGRRAFVVDGGGLVADVDLAGLAVSYHEPGRPASVLDRLRDWLEPAAEAKGGSGSTRSAHWLGGGLLAVAGTDEESSTDARGRQRTRIRPAGLSLVDTRSWSVRPVDPGATDVHVAGDLLLATGASWDSATGVRRAIGLAAYGLDGGKLFHLLAGKEAWIAGLYGGRAYVGIVRADGRQEPLRVVELATGRVTGRRTSPLPWLVLEVASSWWDGFGA
jgi:hypothetical protein